MHTKCRSVLAAAVVCLTIFPGTVQTGLAAPVITAKPESVTLTGESGSTEIQWDTGNGSIGFVFVTGTDQRPGLFATGAKGSQVAPWIQAGKYVFELYGDQDRRTLLTKVIVTGNAETETAPQAMSWRGRARWLLLPILLAILYFAVYLSSAGTLRTTFPTEPTSSPRRLYVARNLLLGTAAFLFVDGAIFHSGLYVCILAPNSYAGRIAEITKAEEERPPSGLKEVLVLGDSRIAEGFSSALADELGSPSGLKFVSLAEPAASANTWYYMVRDVDPTRRRYSAIVIPYGVGYEPNSADPLRISMTAPLLRYADCLHFAAGFQRWSGRFRAFTACILRGSAYQDDVADFVEHPVARLRSIKQEPKRTHSREVYQGRDYDLVGTSYNATSRGITFAPKLTETQRQAIRKSLIQPSESDVEYSLKLQREWIPQIMNRYSNSPTAIVLTPVPRGPFVELPGFSRSYHSVLPSAITQRTPFSLSAQTFEFLEKPEYYFDAFHLNAKGRQKFTETLVSELVGRLRSVDTMRYFCSESKLVVDRPLKRGDAN